MKIECDPAKDASNRAKHGVSLGEAERLDWDEMIATEDRRRVYGERRMIGMSRIGPRLYVVVFTERGNAVRVISLRKANRREVRVYEARVYEASEAGPPERR